MESEFRDKSLLCPFSKPHKNCVLYCLPCHFSGWIFSVKNILFTTSVELGLRLRKVLQKNPKRKAIRILEPKSRSFYVL